MNTCTASLRGQVQLELFVPKNVIIPTNGKNVSNRVALGYATAIPGLSQFRTGFPLSYNLVRKKNKLQGKRNEIIAAQTRSEIHQCNYQLVRITEP